MINIRENSTGVRHPASFPVKLPRFFVQAYSTKGSTWCDPFAGSGSTLVACHQTDRRGIAFEVDPIYTARMIERLALETALEPVQVVGVKKA